MRVEGIKCLISTTNFSVEAIKFGNANQKFGCLNPYHFLVDLTKNEGQLDQNFTLTQPNRYLVPGLNPHKKLKTPSKFLRV